MYASGSKITNQFQQGNKKLSMLMSKQLLYTAEAYRIKNVADGKVVDPGQ